MEKGKGLGGVCWGKETLSLPVGLGSKSGTEIQGGKNTEEKNSLDDK